MPRVPLSGDDIYSSFLLLTLGEGVALRSYGPSFVLSVLSAVYSIVTGKVVVARGPVFK